MFITVIVLLLIVGVFLYVLRAGERKFWVWLIRMFPLVWSWLHSGKNLLYSEYFLHMMLIYWWFISVITVICPLLPTGYNIASKHLHIFFIVHHLCCLGLCVPTLVSVYVVVWIWIALNLGDFFFPFLLMDVSSVLCWLCSLPVSSGVLGFSTSVSRTRFDPVFSFCVIKHTIKTWNTAKWLG